ncbi:hypothetical protein C0J52_25970 [Blattella germanica]|nr:hypothetical protein C0J52_25970 [Blattella germanica]
MAMKILSLLFFVPVAIMTPLNIMICLEEIISKQFRPGEVIVFSLPSTIPDEDMLIIDGAISNISSKEKWPLLISSDSQSTDADIPEPQNGYVIFLVPDEDLLTCLEIQIETLQTFSFSYNRRGKFIIVVVLEEFEDSHILSNEILNTVWNKDNIVNAVVIIRAMVKYDATMNQDREVYGIYSLFPFQSEHCGEFNNSDLLDQWTLSEGFLKGNDLMPEKLPKDLLGCFLHIDIYNIPPLVFISNYSDTKASYDIDGIILVFLNFISEAMNFSIKFEIDKGWNSIYERLLEGRCIAVGGYIMVPHSFSYADVPIPYLYGDFLLYVPCAKKNPSSGNVLKVFSTVVWLLSLSVLLLVSVLFFILQRNDSTLFCYNTLPSCVLNAWAVFLSASVPGMPTGSMFRIFFFLFVCFCFALNTVFQSFLRHPGNEKQIENIDDLNEMGVTFLFNDFINFVEQLTGNKFVSDFKYTKHCEPYDECCKEMLKFENCSILENHLKVEYYASVVRVDRLCTVWRYERAAMVFLMSRGHPILASFNYLIEECFENGFFERYWSLILWSNRVMHITDETEDVFYYSTFGLDHLQICFSFLAIGYILMTIMTPLHIMIFLEEIISKQFLPGEILVISLPSTIPDEDMRIIDGAISNISSNEKWPLLISTDSQNTDAEIPEPQNGYVIFLVPDEDLLASLEIQIETLQTFSFSYNRRGKFIIVVLLEEFEESHILSNVILNTVWNKDNIVNAVVIVRAMEKYDATMNKNREVYDIYSLFPFRSEHCGEFNNSELLDQWTLSEGFVKGNDLMPEKLPNDLLGCFLHIDIYNTLPFLFVSNYTDPQGNVFYDIKGINTVFLNS